MPTNGVHAQTVPFNGIVLPESRSGIVATEASDTVVSFSNQVALVLPGGFGGDSAVAITDEEGNPVQQFELVSVTANGSQSKVALVELNTDMAQRFTICQGRRCIEYKVLRY